jgi:hypothetical protein
MINPEIAAFRRGIEFSLYCLNLDDGRDVVSRNVGSQFGRSYFFMNTRAQGL